MCSLYRHVKGNAHILQHFLDFHGCVKKCLICLNICHTSYVMNITYNILIYKQTLAWMSVLTYRLTPTPTGCRRVRFCVRLQSLYFAFSPETDARSVFVLYFGQQDGRAWPEQHHCWLSSSFIHEYRTQHGTLAGQTHVSKLIVWESWCCLTVTPPTLHPSIQLTVCTQSAVPKIGKHVPDNDYEYDETGQRQDKYLKSGLGCPKACQSDLLLGDSVQEHE